MPINPTWDDTIEAPKWEDTVDKAPTWEDTVDSAPNNDFVLRGDFTKPIESANPLFKPITDQFVRENQQALLDQNPPRPLQTGDLRPEESLRQVPLRNVDSPQQSGVYSGNAQPQPITNPINEIPPTERFAKTKQEFFAPPVPLPKLKINPDDNVVSAVGKEALNLLIGIPEFLESPAGVMTLGAGGVAPRTTAALFSADMVKSAGEQVLNTYKNWNELTPAQKATAVTDIVGTGAFAGLTAKAALTKPKVIADASGKTLETPQGATPPTLIPDQIKSLEPEPVIPSIPNEVETALVKPNADILPEATAALSDKTPAQTIPATIAPEVKAEIKGSDLQLPKVVQPSVWANPDYVPPTLDAATIAPVGVGGLPLDPRLQEQLNAADIHVSPGMSEAILSKKIKSPLAFQKVFPKLSLTLEQAQEVLNSVWKKNENVPAKYLNQPEKSAPQITPQMAPKDWKVTVQSSQDLGNGNVMPGYVQIDDVAGGKNNWSKSPETLAKEGVQVPDFSKLPQGKYTYDEAVAKLQEDSTAKPTEQTVSPPQSVPILGEQQGAVKAAPIEPVTQPLNPEVSGNTHGIAARVLAQEASAGNLAEIPAGIGISPEKSVERGRQLLAGKDTNASFEDLTANLPLGDKVSIARAKGEQLKKAANDAYDKSGVNSPEYKAAQQAYQAWSEKTKTLATEAHKAMVSHQGEVDVNTGDFHSLRQAFADSHGGKELPEKLVPTARKIANDVADSDKKTTQLSDAVIKAADEVYGSEPKTKTPPDQNKILTFLSREADAARQRLLERVIGVRSSATLGLDILADYAIIGAEHIAKGIVKLADWSKAMRDEFGDKITPDLEQIYKMSKLRVKEATANAQAEADLPALREQFSNKTDSKFTADEVKAIWQQAKSRYLSKGVTDFDKIRYGLADDLGLTPEQVVRALQTNPRVKTLTDAMWKKQAETRVLKTKAALWVKYADDNKVWAAIKSLPDRYFGLKVAGHGLVWVGTHTPLLVLDPLTAPLVLWHYGKGFNNLWSKATWQRYISDIANNPRYDFWKRRGLAINIDTPIGEYAESSALLGKFGRTGNRAFDSMKGLRLDIANKLWDAAPDSIKGDKALAESLASQIADDVNHISGALTGKGSSYAAVSALGSRPMRTVFFAPKLYASRFATLLDVPKNLAGFKPGATATERYMAQQTAKHAAAIMGLWGATMLVNQAILSMTGSDRKINVTDPSKSDFMAYKVGRYNVGVASGIVGIAKLVANLYESIARPTPFNSPAGVTSDYLRGKLSPIAGLAVDVATGKNILGRPLPKPIQNARQMVGLKTPKSNMTHKQLGTGEYALEQLAPIPVSEAIHNFYTELENGGFSKSKAMSVIKSIATAIASGATGFRVNETDKK